MIALAAVRTELMTVADISLAVSTTVTDITIIVPMGRWEPNARGRISQAAWELFLDRGYDETTVAAIAQRAGLTERTVFRHFADKREVFFHGASALEGLLVDAVAGAPENLSAFTLSMVGIDAISHHLTDRDFSRRRQEIVDVTPELQERELRKMSHLAASLTRALQARGIEETQANLAAEAGIVIFRVAFERWVGADDERTLAAHAQLAFSELSALTAV